MQNALVRCALDMSATKRLTSPLSGWRPYLHCSYPRRVRQQVFTLMSIFKFGSSCFSELSRELVFVIISFSNP